MPKVGMDVEQVEIGGSALKKHGAAVEGLIGEIESIIRALGAVWSGRDYERFVHEWWPKHRTALRHAGQEVAGLGQSALNNASEQRDVSSGNGTEFAPSPLTGSTTVPGDIGVPSPDLHDSTASSRFASAANDFGNTWNGKYLDYDHVYGNQCFDVFAQYNHDVVGGPDVIAASTGGAKDLYNDFATNGAASHYDRIPGSERPAAGDVVVWNNGYYGHVGVVTSVSPNGYTVLEQNVNAQADTGVAGSLPQQVSHPFNDPQLLGYLRPKG